MTVKAAPGGAGRERSTMLCAQPVGQLDQADVLLLRYGRQDQHTERLYEVRADGTCGRDTKPLGRATAEYARLTRTQPVENEVPETKR